MPEPHLKPVNGGLEKTSFNVPAYWMERCRNEAQRTGKTLAAIFVEGVQLYFEHHYPSSNFTRFENDDTYDPAKFYTFGEDRKGHSYYGRVHIPKTLAGQVAVLVESGRIPEYRSMQHMFRDAIYHRAHQVARMVEDGELERAVSLAVMASNEIAIQDDIAQGRALVEALRMNCESLYAAGGVHQLRRYLGEREEMSDQVPELFRDEWLRVIGEYEKKLRRMSRRNRDVTSDG